MSAYDPGYGGGCASDQACVDLGTGPACQATTIGCGMCGMGEACVADAGGMAVLDDLVEGTGLFASLALTSTGTPIIGCYDRLNGALRMAEGFLPGVYGVRTLGADPMRPRDVGAHVSVAVGPQDRIGLAYMDQTNDDLLFLEYGGAPEVVDNGVTPPDVRLVGADASLLYDAGGSAAIAYQDPTTLDLVYARRLGTPPRWTTEVLRGGAGSSMMGLAAGFYVAQSPPRHPRVDRERRRRLHAWRRPAADAGDHAEDPRLSSGRAVARPERPAPDPTRSRTHPRATARPSPSPGARARAPRAPRATA